MQLSMKPQEALDLLNRVTAQVQGSRIDHIKIQQAINVIQKEIDKVQENKDQVAETKPKDAVDKVPSK